MVPAAFVVLGRAAARPPNGKLDRRALAGAGRRAEPAARAAWRRARRSRSCWPAIWRRGAGASSGSASRTSFFELGGHSLLATRLIARIRAGLRRRAAAARAVRDADGGGAGARDRRAAPGRAAPSPPPLVPVPRDGAAAALLRPAAALVPRSAGAGEPGLQHAGRAAICRAARPRGARRGSGRGRRAATRRCAPASSRSDGRAGPGDRSAAVRCRCR